MNRQIAPTCRSWSQLEIECAKIDSDNYDITEYGKQNKQPWSDYYIDIAVNKPEQWRYISDCFMDMIATDGGLLNRDSAQIVFDYIIDIDSDVPMSIRLYDAKELSTKLVKPLAEAIAAQKTNE